MTFNTQPILEDSLVHLRPLLPEDIEPLWAVASDPLMWDQHPAKRHQRDVYEKLFADSIASKGAMVIIDKATGKIIGSSRYLWPEGVTTVIEIGYSYLARAYWGGIYNSAVKTLILNHAFNTFDTVIFYIAKQNMRSRKAVEKIGGEQIFITEYPQLVRKSEADVTYRIKREVWQERMHARS
jgi:RimJ/RimL family protein N-acetyltransferase